MTSISALYKDGTPVEIVGFVQDPRGVMAVYVNDRGGLENDLIQMFTNVDLYCASTDASIDPKKGKTSK